AGTRRSCGTWGSTKILWSKRRRRWGRRASATRRRCSPRSSTWSAADDALPADLTRALGASVRWSAGLMHTGRSSDTIRSCQDCGGSGRGGHGGIVSDREPTTTVDAGDGRRPETLKRVMGPKLLLLFIVGDILGTGVYALTGKVAGQVGGAGWAPV